MVDAAGPRAGFNWAGTVPILHALRSPRGRSAAPHAFADVFGIPASRARGRAGASLGAAVCAAVAVDLHPDFETAAARMERPRETFVPDAGNADVYRRLDLDVFRGIRESTDRVLERTWPIFN